MKLAVLSNKTNVGKLHTKDDDSKHFVSGQVKHIEFSNLEGLQKIIKTVAGNPKMCCAVGHFPHNGKVVPSEHKDVGLDKVMTRTKNSMTSGNVLVVDNDTGKKFDSEIFAKYWGAFKDAGFVRSKSGSTLLGKKKNGTHDYYMVEGEFNDFKTTMKIMEAICIVEGFFTLEFYTTGRAVIKTPVDIKLNEPQMPIYEDDEKPKLMGGKATVKLGKLPKNYEKLMKQAEKIVHREISAVDDESLKLHKKWLKKRHNIVGLKKNELKTSLGDYARNFVTETTRLFQGKKMIGTVGDLLLGNVSGNLFNDVNEPDYGGWSQKARWYGSMFHSQAHGGVNYYVRISEKFAKEHSKELGKLSKKNISVISNDIESFRNESGDEKVRAFPKLIDTDNKDSADTTVISAYLQTKGMNFWDGSILDYDMLYEISKYAKIIDGEFVMLPSMKHGHLFGTTINISKQLASIYPILQDMDIKGNMMPTDIKGTVAVIKTMLDMCSTSVPTKLNNVIRHSVLGVSNNQIVGTALVETIPINKPALLDMPDKPKQYKEIVKMLMSTSFGNAEDLLKYALANKVIPQKKQFILDESGSNSMKTTLIAYLTEMGLAFSVKPDSLLKSDTNKTAPQQFPKYWLLAFDDTVKVFKDSYYEIASRMAFAVAYGRSTVNVDVPVIYVASADGVSGMSEQRQNRMFELDEMGALPKSKFGYSDIGDSAKIYLYELATRIHAELIENPAEVANEWVTEILSNHSEDTVSSASIVSAELSELLWETMDIELLPAVRHVKEEGKHIFIMVEKASSPSSMLDNLYSRSGNKLHSKEAMYEFKNISWEDIGGVHGRLTLTNRVQHTGVIVCLAKNKFVPIKCKDRFNSPEVIVAPR